MDALVEGIRNAQTTAAIGRVLLDATQRLIGHSGLSFLRVEGPVITMADVFATCAREPPRRAAELLLEMMPFADRELNASEPMSQRASFDVAKRFDPELVRRSEVFNQFWRPLQIERQLVGCFGIAPAPAGFLCIARSAREPAFTPGDFHALERIRAAVDRELAAGRYVGQGDLHETLLMLARTTPSACFVFDGGGRLVWLTEEACSRLSLDSWRFASSIAIRHSPALEKLQAWVRAAAKRRDPASTPRCPNLGIGATGEQLVMRRFEARPGRPLFVVGFADPALRGAVTPGRAAGPETGLRADRLARRHGLTRRQTEVLRHVAHGKPNKTVAALLRCAENTVELHVTALLAKIGCENRAQLVARFWTS